MTRIGIVLFDGAEELDYAGPWEVFAAAAYLSPELNLDVRTYSKDGAPIRSAKGLRVIPHASFADAPRLDVVLAPGGEGRKREMHDETMLGWLRKQGAEATWITSVCTGAFLLHAAGLAKGRRMTTHWSAVEELRARGDVTVLDGIRYVRDGNVVSAAGVSAGIDMALWLVGQLWEPAFARKVQRYIQYEPAPPYAADV